MSGAECHGLLQLSALPLSPPPWPSDVCVCQLERLDDQPAAIHALLGADATTLLQR